ncbi:endopeptidase La [Oscillospiraceae bacterium MB08-C2-2]|nr:endopeptidase La [Oscillospiraceae bacterium MB08-C2-2]
MKNADTSIQPIKIPMLAMRGMVLFPQMVLHFDVGRDKSILALNEVMNADRRIYLVAQKDVRDEEPDTGDVYTVGVVGEVKQIIKSQNHLRVLVEGLYRARTLKILEDEPYFEALIEEYPVNSARGGKKSMLDALLRTVKDLFEEYSSLTPRMPKDMLINAIASENPEFISQYIAANMPIKTVDKQKILEESSIAKRLRLLIHIMEEENEILSLEQEIQEKVRDQIDTNQREYYLREQMKAISAELGDGDSQSEAYEYHEKIEALKLDEESAERLHKEADRLLKMPGNSHEAGVIKTYLDTCLELPWNKTTRDRFDIAKAKKQLDADHYGMEKVKERILEMLAVRKLAPDMKGQIICLAGPPGVGKTSVANSIAKSLGRKYVRMSLGGVRDESDIRGHRKTYVGSMPGRIINAMRQAGTKNPLLLLDEVDKLGSDYRGDPSAALLEVLDSEQNFAFRDHYIEIPFDLSQVLFIATANNLSTIPRPLLDRMEVINLTSYTRQEKFSIAKKYLVKKQSKKHGLTSATFKLADGAIFALIDHYTREAGVRSLEREIASLCRKAAKKIVGGELEKVTINAQNIQEYLGAHKFKLDVLEDHDEVGLVNGLAWTSVGGEMLEIEVAVLEGNGKVVLTGSLGDVMKESAQAAISYVRTCCEKYGIPKDFYKTKDIHIHVPEGAVPKDGPSAGITICTALVSALSGIAVHREVAMTGEISLRGRVLPIGGLKEKTMAAYRLGIKTIIIPQDNLSDLEEVDPVVKQAIRFIPAKHIRTVLDVALVEKYTGTAEKAQSNEVIPALEYETDVLSAKAVLQQ